MQESGGSKVSRTPFDGDKGGEGGLAAGTLRLFLQRMLERGLCSVECFVIALIYIERLLQAHPTFVITWRNVHRLVLVATMVASKMLDDHYCRNEFYADAAGVTKAELNDMELQLCFLLDFFVAVKPEQFSRYCAPMAREPAVPPLLLGAPLLSPAPLLGLPTPPMSPGRMRGMPWEPLTPPGIKSTEPPAAWPLPSLDPDHPEPSKHTAISLVAPHLRHYAFAPTAAATALPWACPTFDATGLPVA